MSRANEREADLTGVRILARAGYDPRIGVRFFDRLQEFEVKNDSTPPWMSTHPLTSERAADAKRFADDAVPLFVAACDSKARPEERRSAIGQKIRRFAMPPRLNGF